MSKKPAAITEPTTTEGVNPISAAAQAPINAKLKPEARIDIFRTIVRIRRFEERCLRAYQQGKIGGFLHLYIGQEAVAAGCVSVLGENDHIITAYRDHGHGLAVGMTMKEMMAENYGKATGCSKGKGGSMHYFAPDKHFWGGHGIVGGQIPLGTGIAFALKYQGLKGACLAFMGDGAINQGPVHESYNLAALWDVPVVFIIENNGYSMGTSQVRSSAGESLAKRAEGYGMTWDVCNGHDLYEVRQKVGEALALAHDKSRPSVLEIRTYRYRGHSVSDPDSTYRRKSEIEDYRRTKDPLQLFQNSLLAEGVLDEDKIARIDAAARAEADAAADFADASPPPTVEDISKDIYWEQDAPADQRTKGRLLFD